MDSKDKADMLADRCGREAIEAMDTLFAEHYDGIAATCKDNPDFEEMIPMAVTLNQVTQRLVQMAQMGPVMVPLVEIGLDELKDAYRCLFRLTYFRGYQRGKLATSLQKWTVAVEQQEE